MNKNFDIISIPVAPHVHKFMTATFGDVYQLSKNDQIGIMILSMLSKTNSTLDPSVDLPSPKSFFQVSISLNYFTKKGFSIDYEQRKMIGKVLDLYFRDIVFSHAVMSNKCFGYEIKKSVINFCEVFGITVDDINPETLCRDLRRKKSADSPNLITVLNQFEPEMLKVSV